MIEMEKDVFHKEFERNEKASLNEFIYSRVLKTEIIKGQ